MSEFSALILGVGDAFTKKHYGSSALLRGAGGDVLLDCPDLIHRALAEAATAADWNVDVLDIHDVILTHLHGDHCNGLESFGFLHRFARMENSDLPTPRLYAIQPVLDRLWERLAPAMDAQVGGRPSELSDYFDVRTLTSGERTTIAGLTVECRITQHPIPAIGLRVSDDASTLGWSGDTSYVQEHIDWLENADLIVHETNYGPAHTQLHELNALPVDMRRRMRLIHIPDDFNQADTDIAALSEGDVLSPAHINA